MRKRKRPPGSPPNVAARTLRDGEFRQRIVKAKKAYTRRIKHKKGDVDLVGRPLFAGPQSQAFGDKESFHINI